MLYVEIENAVPGRDTQIFVPMVFGSRQLCSGEPTARKMKHPRKAFWRLGQEISASPNYPEKADLSGQPDDENRRFSDRLLPRLPWNRSSEIASSNLVDVIVWHPTRGRAKVFFCYKYLCSLNDLYAVPDREGLIVVNLHNWNDGPFTNEAIDYAMEIGMSTMNQKEFFEFISREFR